MNDKFKHFIVGVTFGVATSLFNIEVIGFTASSAVFFGKEVLDIYKPRPTGFDWKDIDADYNGFFFGYGIASLIKNIIL